MSPVAERQAPMRKLRSTDRSTGAGGKSRVGVLSAKLRIVVPLPDFPAHQCGSKIRPAVPFQNITYRTLAASVVTLFLGFLLSALPSLAAPLPAWWHYAVQSSQKAWLRSLDCHCEQSFAIDLTDNGVNVRWFLASHPDEYHSQIRITPETVALFHTHLYDSLPSWRDRELEKKSGIPVYVIHGTNLVECRP